MTVCMSKRKIDKQKESKEGGTERGTDDDAELLPGLLIMSKC